MAYLSPLERRASSAAEGNLRLVGRGCADFESKKVLRPRLYRGLRGLDVSCFVLASRGGCEPTASCASTRPELRRGSGAPSEGKGAQRAAEALRRCPFFASAESTRPGVIASLSQVAEFVACGAGQVLYREGDPQKSCYAIVSGSVGLHSQSDPSEDGEVKRSKSARLPAGQPRTGPERRYCLEQHSTYSNQSNFGELVLQLHIGAMFGEQALVDRSEPWRTTARCMQDTELLTLPADQCVALLEGVYRELMFFDAHLLAAAEWTKKVLRADLAKHPACYFHKETFDAGMRLLTEGLLTEPMLFLVASGTLEFQKTARPHKFPAWCVGLQPLANARSSPQFAPPGAAVRARVAAGDGQGQRRIACGTLAEGDAFCSLATLPIPGREPLSAATTSRCSIYVASEVGMRHIPDADLVAIKQAQAAELAQRMRRLESAMADADEHSSSSSPASAVGAADIRATSTAVDMRATSTAADIMRATSTAWPSLFGGMSSMGGLTSDGEARTPSSGAASPTAASRRSQAGRAAEGREDFWRPGSAGELKRTPSMPQRPQFHGGADVRCSSAGGPSYGLTPPGARQSRPRFGVAT